MDAKNDLIQEDVVTADDDFMIEDIEDHRARAANAMGYDGWECSCSSSSCACCTCCLYFF